MSLQKVTLHEDSILQFALHNYTITPLEQQKKKEMSSNNLNLNSDQIASSLYISGKEAIYKKYLDSNALNCVPTDISSAGKLLQDHKWNDSNPNQVAIISESELGLKAMQFYLANNSEFSEIKVFQLKDEDRWMEFRQCQKAVWLFNSKNPPNVRFNTVNSIIFLERPESEESFEITKRRFANVGREWLLQIKFISIKTEEEKHRFLPEPVKVIDRSL